MRVTSSRLIFGLGTTQLCLVSNGNLYDPNTEVHSTTIDTIKIDILSIVMMDPRIGEEGSIDHEKEDLVTNHDCWVEGDAAWPEHTHSSDPRLAISPPTLSSQDSERSMLPVRNRIESEVTIRTRNQRPWPPSSPRSGPTQLRWMVLALTCCLMAGIYYSLDIPAALHQQLKDFMPQSTHFETKFNLLFTLYSLPNVILPFVGGYFVDRLGPSWCLMIFTSFCFLGQLTFTLGMFHKKWTLMLLGRTMYGFGGESISVAYSTLLGKWFAGKEVALAFGVALAFSRLGSVCNNLVSPFVANRFSPPWAAGIGLCFNVFSVLISCMLDHVDNTNAVPPRPVVPSSTNEFAEPLLAPDENDDEEGTNVIADHNIVMNMESTRWDVLRFGSIFWLLSISCFFVYGCLTPFNNVVSGILLERNYFKTPPVDCQLQYPNQCSYGTLQNGTNPAFDMFNISCPGNGFAPVLPTSINITNAYMRGLLAGADVDCSVAFWSSGCTKDYCEAMDRATETTGRVMSVPYFLVAGLSPLLGGIVDRVGHRAVLSLVASLMLIAVHTTMALSSASPVLPLIGQGMAYSLFAAVLWPSVTLVVEERLTGTAFGVMTSIQNIGLALFPMLIATIYNNSDERYIPHVELFFVACATVGSICSFGLIFLDRRTGRKLQSVTGMVPAAGGHDGDYGTHVGAA